MHVLSAAVKQWDVHLCARLRAPLGDHHTVASRNLREDSVSAAVYITICCCMVYLASRIFTANRINELRPVVHLIPLAFFCTGRRWRLLGVSGDANAVRIHMIGAKAHRLVIFTVQVLTRI